MKTVACVMMVLAVLACAVPDTSTSTQPVCTQEDIDNGTCGDPGGGGPNDTATAVEDHASSVIASYVASGNLLVSRSPRTCIQSSERTVCMVRVDFGSFRVNVTCETVGGTTGCSSTVSQS